MSRYQGEKSLVLQSIDFKGARTVIPMSNRCGMCSEFQSSWDTPDEELARHDKCPREIAWFDKLWICPCPCNTDWVPQNTGDPNYVAPSRKQKQQAQEPPESPDEVAEQESAE